MAKLKSTIRFANKKQLQQLVKTNFVNDKLLNDVDRLVVDGVIKKLISRGVSPVRGRGRYGEYVDPKKYPGKGKNRQKPSRPVNLFLTGEMLRNFTAHFRRHNTVSVGIQPQASPFVATKFIANNYGTERNGVGAVPKRQMIPTKSETWAVSVVRAVRILFTRRMKILLSKK